MLGNAHRDNATTSAVAISRRFVEVYGRPPEAIWCAPGRVNLIGEYTDINQGFVLPFAVEHVTTAAAARRGDRRLGLCSLRIGPDEPAILELEDGARTGDWSDYPLGVALALGELGYRLAGADVLIASDLPIGAGLSSSAALECSVGAALCAVSGIELAPIVLAQLAQQAENRFVGVPCGLMDQAAAMCCVAGHAMFFDTRHLTMRQVPFDPSAAGLALLLVDTRVKHRHASSSYGERRHSCDEAARLLEVEALRDIAASEADAALRRLRALGGERLARRARHVLSEHERVLETVRMLETHRVREIGPILVAGHRSCRDDLEVSSPELDLVVEVALANGAAGARMTGGGFGGCVVVLTEPDTVPTIASALRRRCAELGMGEPHCSQITPSDGARAMFPSDGS